MAFSNKNLTSGEHIELQLRTHAKAIVGPVLLAIVLVAAMVLAFVFVPDGSAHTWILLAVAIVLLVVAVLWVVIPILKWLTNIYVITNRRIITRHGIISKAGRDIPLYRINDVSYEKGASDRIFGCGTLLISDASDNPPLLLHDVPKVEQVQVRINELLFAHDGTDDGRIPATDATPRRAERAPRQVRGRDERSDVGRYEDEVYDDRAYDDRAHDDRGYDPRVRGESYTRPMPAVRDDAYAAYDDEPAPYDQAADDRFDDGYEDRHDTRRR